MQKEEYNSNETKLLDTGRTRGRLTVFLPLTLHLDNLVEENPIIETESNSKQEAIHVSKATLEWMIGTVIYFRYLKNNEDEEWVKIGAKYWNAHAKRYRDHIRWLVRHEILLVNEHYSNYEGNSFCKAYALHERYRGVEVVERKTEKRITHQKKEQENDSVKQKCNITSYLNSWLKDERLKIEHEYARTLTAGMTIHQKNAWKIVESMARNRRSGQRDSTAQRFHSWITATPRKMRSAVLYNGQNLISLDVRNSQPFFFALMIKDLIERRFLEFDVTYFSSEYEFGTRTNSSSSKDKVNETRKKGSMQLKHDLSKHNNIRLDFDSTYIRKSPSQALSKYVTTNQCMYNPDAHYSSKTAILCMSEYVNRVPKIENEEISTICYDQEDNLRKHAVLKDIFDAPLWTLVAEDIKRFIKTNHDGTLYELFAEQWDCTRDEAKNAMFVILFGENRYLSTKEILFKESFPTVYQIIKDQKHIASNALAIFLQKLESEMMLGTVCRYLMNKYPEVPLYTVHDCILTIPEYAPMVEALVYQMFIERYGIAPVLKVEPWVSPSWYVARSVAIEALREFVIDDSEAVSDHEQRASILWKRIEYSVCTN